MQRLSLWVVNNNGYKDVAHIFDSGLECNTSSCIFSFSIKHFLSSLFSLYSKALVIELCMTHAMFKALLFRIVSRFLIFIHETLIWKGWLRAYINFCNVWTDVPFLCMSLFIRAFIRGLRYFMYELLFVSRNDTEFKRWQHAIRTTTNKFNRIRVEKVTKRWPRMTPEAFLYFPMYCEKLFSERRPLLPQDVIAIKSWLITYQW